MQGIVEHFGSFDSTLQLRPLLKVEEADMELRALGKDGGKVVLGVGAVPCYEPKTDEEKRVYAIAEAVFGREDGRVTGKLEDGTLALPDKPIFVGTSSSPFPLFSPPRTLHVSAQTWRTNLATPSSGRWLSSMAGRRGVGAKSRWFVSPSLSTSKLTDLSR
jgi:hypothetical protein